ncbi:uncharacterized protein LOC106878945 isoform X2 [Octopus bimaculoides]|uniref:uncharacterized protein LOC106878945 isoform X2 n=1 Tax=Octopus bimaculoides TaxID=37653 RepID=UPI0022E7C57A|nr:uncharacterized protein LOC106878945 isoform X2 [Octopus bimaculoides]
MTKEATWLMYQTCLALLVCLLPKVKTTTENPELSSEHEEFFMNLTHNVENIGTSSSIIFNKILFGDTQIPDMNETVTSNSSNGSISSIGNNTNSNDSSINNSNGSSTDIGDKLLVSTDQDIIMEPPGWEPVNSIIITNCSNSKSFSLKLYDDVFHYYDDINTFFLLASLSQHAAFSLAEDILNIFEIYFSMDKCQLEIVMAIIYMGVTSDSVSQSEVKYVIYYDGVVTKIIDTSEKIVTEKLTNYPIKLNYPTTVNLKEDHSTTALPTSLDPKGHNKGLPWSLIIILCAIFTIIILPISVIFFLCQRRMILLDRCNKLHLTGSSIKQMEYLSWI